jgi:energy-coupling factor transporter ATP-binding protein EcfA2
MLNLPKRYEVMQRLAKQAGVASNGLLEADPAAGARVSTLLCQIKTGGLGRFEVFLGSSGSGKSSFFENLAQTFPTMKMREIPLDVPLSKVAQYIRQHRQPQLWLLNGRDNLTVPDEEATHFFTSLRVLFREQAGQVLLCWPLSDISQAEALSTQAWQTGRDSICDLSQGLYRFQGPCKSSFYAIADRSAQMFNDHKLDYYGLTHAVAAPLIAASQTIAEFYARLDAAAIKINGSDKPHPELTSTVAQFRAVKSSSGMTAATHRAFRGISV